MPPPFGRPLGLPMAILLILAAVALASVLTGTAATGGDAISYDEFVKQVKDGNVTKVLLSGDHLEGEFAKELAAEAPGRKPRKTFALDLNPYLREGFDKLMQEHDEIRKVTRTPTDGTGFLMGLYMLVPLLLMAGFWMTLRRARDPLGNTGFLGGFSKSPAKRYDAKDKQVTFADVAGLEQVKAAEVSAAGRPRAQGCAADGPAGHRQDAPRPGRGRRGGRALLLDLGQRVHPDVRGRGRLAGARPLQDGQGSVARHPLHRRDRRRGPRPRRRPGGRPR
jgi:hypothetical protein